MEGGRRDVVAEIARKWREAARFLAGAAFPHFCCACGSEGGLLCADCAFHVKAPIEGIFVCPGCGERTPFGARCPRDACRDRTSLDGLMSAAPYGRPVLRELLRLHKYERVDEAGEAIVGAFDVFLKRYGATLTAIFGGAIAVPVPMHPFKRAYRGFNQAEPLASALAARTGATLGRDVLHRRFGFRSQAGYDTDAARKENAKGSVFAGNVRGGGRYVLVDDVVTSGATLEASAATLKDAGAAEVWAVTFLRGSTLHKKGSNR